MKHMKFDAAVFDLDGTLLDTLYTLAAAANRALSELSLPQHEAEDFRFFVGDGVKNMARRMLGAASQDEELVAKVTERFILRYYEELFDGTRPYDGVEELLSYLAEKKVKMCVLSNKPHDYVGKLTRHFFPSIPFVRAEGQKPNVPRKPDPTVLLSMMADMGTEGVRCLYLGDTGTDMQTARAGGACSVGALWGFRSKEELVKEGAMILAAHPRDIFDLF